jgi:hypothetical protein
MTSVSIDTLNKGLSRHRSNHLETGKKNEMCNSQYMKVKPHIKYRFPSIPPRMS